MTDKQKPEKSRLLEEFMKEHFPFTDLKKAGFFTKEMKGDYEAQAERVCKFFGYKTVFEYGAVEVKAHLSFPRTLEVNPEGELVTQPFITVFKSHLDS